MATAIDVAEYMVKRLDEVSWLYQEQIVYEIQGKFGEPFVYFNANGNLAIGKDVLKEFKRLTGDDIVWERGPRLWRRRLPYDTEGRRQD